MKRNRQEVYCLPSRNPGIPKNADIKITGSSIFQFVASSEINKGTTNFQLANRQQIYLTQFYRQIYSPETKFGEGNVFTGVCLSTVAGCGGGQNQIHHGIGHMVGYPFPPDCGPDYNKIIVRGTNRPSISHSAKNECMVVNYISNCRSCG